MKIRSQEISCYNHCIALKFDRHFCSAVCRDACQISEWLEKSKPESRGFETSRDLAERRPSAQLIGPVLPWHDPCGTVVMVESTWWSGACLALTYHQLISSYRVNIGSDNALSPGRHQAIIWTNAGILLIGSLGTNLSEILFEIHTFSFTKIHLKMSSTKMAAILLRGSWVKT